MCIGKSTCTELDINPERWDKTCPLRPLDWFETQLDIFADAVDEFINGNRSHCLEILANIRSNEMRDWFVEHGQMAGMHRRNMLNIPTQLSVAKNLRDPLRSPKKYEADVFKRDGYRCRYCGIRLVSNRFLSAFTKHLDSELFRKGPDNLRAHGIVHIFNPVADHVVPWVVGGRTNVENLVASCGSCNYGKAGYTTEQIGIANPFSREPKIDTWDGLVSKLDAVKSRDSMK